MASTNTPPEIPPRRHSSTVSPNKIINQNSDAESKTKPPSFLSRRHSSCIDDNMDNETDTICLFLTLIACSSLLISADQGSNYGYGQTEYMNGHPSSSSSFKSNSGSGQPIAARPNTGQAPYAPQNARPALDRNPNGMQADYVPAGSGSSSYQYRNQYKRSIAPQYYSAPAADTQYCSDDAPATPLQATKNIWALAPQETLEYNNYYLHAAPAAPQYYSARPLLAPRFSSAATVVAARPQYHSVQTDAADEPCN